MKCNLYEANGRENLLALKSAPAECLEVVGGFKCICDKSSMVVQDGKCVGENAMQWSVYIIPIVLLFTAAGVICICVSMYFMIHGKKKQNVEEPVVACDNEMAESTIIPEDFPLHILE